MRILSIETSTEACSAALLIDGEVRERFEVAPSQHSQLILPMIDSLLNEAQLTLSQLDTVGFSCGPGSFTGLRIAAGVIQGIALGADLPVVRVSTLATLAQYAYEEKSERKVLAALDARMGEVYWGKFQFDAKGRLREVDSEIVCAPDQVTKPLAEEPEAACWFGVGPGWTAHSAKLLVGLNETASSINWQENILPRAQYVASLAMKSFVDGGAVSAEEAVPVYLRNNIARKKVVRHESTS